MQSDKFINFAMVYIFLFFCFMSENTFSRKKKLNHLFQGRFLVENWIYSLYIGVLKEDSSHYFFKLSEEKNI